MRGLAAVFAALAISGCATGAGTLRPEVPATPPQFATAPVAKKCSVGVQKDGQTQAVEAECFTVLKEDLTRLIRERIFYCISATDDSEGCGVKK